MGGTIESLLVSLSERLWALERGGDDAPRLIMPTKRDMFERLSEQESRVLLCNLLEEPSWGWHFSIETPTRKTYLQSGKKPQSARIDVSLYDDASPASLSTNIELKAHNPGPESFRKDFEKLLKEGVDGIWFHSLARADRTTVNSVFAKIRESFATESKHLGGSPRRFTFAFAALQTGNVAIAEFDVGGDSHLVLAKLCNLFEPSHLDGNVTGGWKVFEYAAEGTRPASSFIADSEHGAAGQGARSGQLVYCPEIDPSTFLHLSVRGDSYNFRRYSDGSVNTFKTPGIRSFAKLVQTHSFGIRDLATPEDLKHNIDAEPGYWQNRIEALNRKYLDSEG